MTNGSRGAGDAGFLTRQVFQSRLPLFRIQAGSSDFNERFLSLVQRQIKQRQHSHVSWLRPMANTSANLYYHRQNCTAPCIACEFRIKPVSNCSAPIAGGTDG